MIEPMTRSKGRLISSPRIRFSSVQVRSGEVQVQKYQDPSRTLDRCPTHAHTQSEGPANRARREGEREPSRSIYMHAALHSRVEQSRAEDRKPWIPCARVTQPRAYPAPSTRLASCRLDRPGEGSQDDVRALEGETRCAFPVGGRVRAGVGFGFPHPDESGWDTSVPAWLARWLCLLHAQLAPVFASSCMDEGREA
ncbi:uncharacterized protein K489DRAFT_126049 [Dissoconium aciculare CBS 342.82]|jgi:hypothetical protein|uniref:Uncharacterized protein n=1 Tax=Dissoconium aciculare CBS 342.82 TaxID=1314786 RepID=A0A6J3MFN8_9PEZI|nr:uncharacterized protein K489DRAFT_126049 [Dissoconium aciculare CBS 342.82]KAF1826816.1 hypothetical protein K489DRAFT_126049 [Dissoconium aciculare CBS 342.82]